MDTKAIAESARRLRRHTVALLDDLGEEEYHALALPPRDTGGEAWSVADVFRHLAEMDRRSVLGTGLVALLPWQDEKQYEDAQDAALERLRTASRPQLREELITWGRRLQRLIRLTPAVVARRTVPTLFGEVTLAWLAALRLYDEWIHQDDVRQALHRPEVPPDAETREILAELQLRGLPGGPLRRIAQDEGVVEVAFRDVLAQPAWRFDLARRQFGERVPADPTVRVEADIDVWCRIAAQRASWKEAEDEGGLEIVGADRDAAAALLDVVRIV